MITIVMPYYENKWMLARHLLEWSRYSRTLATQLRFIIVDDGSKRNPISSCITDDPSVFQVYRIKQNIPWNVPGARNLGMHVAPDEGWCLLTDIDHLLTAPEAELLASMHSGFKPGRFYVPGRRWADGRPLHPHPNSYILQKKLYWQVGGTDEDFSGYWGAGEQAFRKQINQAACRVDISIKLDHYGRDDIADASTTDWGRRGSEFDWNKQPNLVKKVEMGTKPKNPLRFEWERVL